MILTNVNALQSQVEHTKAQDNFSEAARRLSSGVWSSSSAFDAGGLSQASRMQSEKNIDHSYRLNLQNARSYLLTQQEGLQKNSFPGALESTDLTLQIETKSIGIIYQEGQAAPYDENDPDSPIDPDNTGTPGIKFVPEHPDLEIPIDHQGNKIGIAAKSFGTLYSESPVYGELHSLETAGKAADTLDHLRGNRDYYGEARCVMDDRLSAVASELNRIDQEIEKLEEREVQNIAAIGKIVDTDMAADATELAKSKIRSDLATSCISKSIGINDALIPLTTKHYRGAILKT